MTAFDSGPAYDRESPHDAVGAYVLGVLDDADATAFEAHLAGCERCAEHLEEFSGLEPMLALLSEGPGPAAVPGQRTGAGTPGVDPYADDTFDAFAPRPPSPRPAIPRPALVEPPVAPRPELLDRLVDEVGARRAQRRRRTRYLIAAAAALIIGGPAVAVVATSGDGRSNVAADPHPTSPAEDAFFHHMEEKLAATDATTKVSATVGIEKKGWGTHTVLELKNVKGPLKCTLVAVSKTGEEEIVTSWAVPKWGYGIPDSPNEAAKNPLYVHGGAAMNRDEIDRFEVRTFDGDRLVEVDA
ncbi:anti-sigma factor family protein [Streptomyces sp. NPDC048604]|uniref:anti-sigma factor family protein n=1 Tax=Streptomyces sp. NPDC048604 TaxID=3365578 RepID=UPI00371C4697